MKRIWRFILALSVTPLMTAACLAILAWMTWNVAREERFGSSQWHLGKVVNWLQGNPMRYPQKWLYEPTPPGVLQRVKVLIEDGDTFRLITPGMIPDDTPNLLVVLSDGDPVARCGAFAITSEDRLTTATLMQNGKVVSSSALSVSTARKIEKNQKISHFAIIVLSGSGVTTTVLWSGYAYNIAAVNLASVCLYSLQWMWRGARMPWGDNRAWKNAAGSPTRWWWCRRTILCSPMTTLTCAAILFVLTGVNAKPYWDWQYRLRRVLLVSTQTVNLWEFQTDSVPQPHTRSNFMERSRFVLAPWLNDEEKAAWGSRGIVIPAFRFVEFTFLAPMTTVQHPAVTIVDASATAKDLEARRAHVERTMIARGVITPDQAPLLWTAQPKRIVWQGVLFNGTMLIVACALLASLLWLRDGVVWPWNARRLRKGACLKCGYSLSGLNTATCPECGTTPQSLA